MYKVLKADKDTYITDRVVKNERVFTSNVGGAGSLDLFKLYGYTTSGSLPNVELSRLLIHFDLDPIRELVTAGKIDINNASFSCKLKLFDVYGGQPTPRNFTVAVHPLSMSFDEGLGRDVVYYSDRDVSNFLTASWAQGTWLMSGCGLGGGLPGSVDYITSSTSVATTLKSTQVFTTGEEDLDIDVTTAVSATLAGILPDEGFRVSFDASIEDNQRTYFVKRFAGRTAFNDSKHPRLVFRYDSSIQDDSQNMTLGTSGTLFLYNYNQRSLSNLTSGSSLTQITGSNSLVLRLTTPISGGTYSLSFTGSQHNNGTIPVTGIYSASVLLSPTDTTLLAKIALSGSAKLVPVWESIDGSLAYVTASAIYVYPPTRGGTSLDPKELVVTVMGLQPTYRSDETSSLRINIFDHTSPTIKAVKTPVELPGIVVRDVHYQVRDAVSGLIEVPFDTTFNSTRASSDTSGMYFTLDASNLTVERTYVIDVMVVTNSSRRVYKTASVTFKVTDLT